MKTTYEPFATVTLLMPRRRKAINVSLSRRARAIADILAEKDGTTISGLLEGLLLSELARGGRITPTEVQTEMERIRREAQEQKDKQNEGK